MLTDKVASVKKEPGLHLKMEPMDGGKAVTSSVKDKVESSKLEPMSVEEQMSSAASGESSAAGVIVIVGRSGLTPPPSPTPVTCSDQVQIPNSRIVAQQSPNKRYVLFLPNPRMREFIRKNSVNKVCISIPNCHTGNEIKIEDFWFVFKSFFIKFLLIFL